MTLLASDDPLLLADRVVVVDACSALDIIRIPVRSKWNADATSVQEVLATITTAPLELVLTMPSAIEAEFENHRDGEAQASLNELRQQHNSLQSKARLLKQMGSRCHLSAEDLPAVDLPSGWAEAVSGRFVDLASEVHAQVVVLPHDEDDVPLAYSRVATLRAPAARGATSMNDSILCEAALRVARQRQPGTTGLLTSNTADFRPSGSLPHDLISDYGGVGLIDLPTWRDVLRFVGASPTL